MASTSIETLILFIATMLIAVSVAGTFTESVGRLARDIVAQGTQVTEEVRTDVEIISDGGSDAVYDEATTNVTLLVKNAGTNALAPEVSTIGLYVDSRYQSDFEVTLVTDGSTWEPGGVVRVETDTDVAPDTGLHRARVIVNGDRETLTFRA